MSIKKQWHRIRKNPLSPIWDYITADFTRVNFQPDANDIVAGWLVDDGDAFGFRSGGGSYGWVLSGDPKRFAAVKRHLVLPLADSRFNYIFWAGLTGRRLRCVKKRQSVAKVVYFLLF